MEPRSNTRRNCDYCVEKKVRCSGRIDGAACHYCARKNHVCVFSLKQKPGPKCSRHLGEGAPPFSEESLGVDAISSAAAALSLSGSKPGLAAAATVAWSQSAKGKRGSRSSTSRAFSAAEKRAFAPGESVGDCGGYRDHVMEEAGGGPPAESFLGLGCYGGGVRAANGDSRAVLPPTPIDGKVGGSSGGSVSAGKSGSFLEFPLKPAPFEASTKEDELIDELLGQLEPEEDVSEAQPQPQQEPQQDQKAHKQLTPPPKKKVKVNRISGPDQAGPDHGLITLWNQAAPPPPPPPSQTVAAPPRDAASATRPPRPGSLNPAISAAQRVVSAAAASAAAATMTTEVAAAAAAVAAASAVTVTATGQAGVAAAGATVERQPRPLSRIKSINSNGNGSWRRLLNHRSSFVLENGGDVCGAGGGLLASCSSWSDRGGGGGGRVSGAQSPVFEINDAAAGPFGAPAALATAVAAGPVQQGAVQVSVGGFGPVAEPLESVTPVRTDPYGMVDWLLPAGVTPNGDLLEAVSGVPAAGMLAAADHHGVVPPLAGGGGGVGCVVTGGDYQF
ncbi:unnamed protein product [Ectocarpus fasciculatus]